MSKQDNGLKDFTILRDFRNNKAKGAFTTGLIFMMREVQQKQEWMKNLLTESEAKELPFIGKFTTFHDPAKVAQDIRSTLGIRTNEIASNPEPLKYFIERVESNRIFVSQSSNYHNKMLLDSDEIKGFAITDNTRLLFIKSEDWKNAQVSYET